MLCCLTLDMISLSKFCPRFLSINKPTTNFTIAHNVRLRIRLFSGESRDPSITRIRNAKRYFAFGLFGVTLLAALTVKRRRKKEWNDLLARTDRVGNFGKLVLFEFKHYMLPKPVLEMLDKIKRFGFRENDVVLSSFPKTGQFADFF